MADSFADLGFQEIQANAPDFKDLGFQELSPRATKRAALVAEQAALAKEETPSLAHLFINEASQPFVALPKPEIQPDDSKAMQFTKGVVQSAEGLIEGVESPLGVSLTAISAIPVIGVPLSKTIAVAFGFDSLLNGFKDAAQAYEQGDAAKGGRAFGQIVTGSAIIRGLAPSAKVPVALEKADAPLADVPAITTPSETITPQTDIAVQETAPIVVPSAESVPTVTGIRNAIVDQERIERELPPAEPVLRRSFGPVWDDALLKIQNDPTFPDDLINELRDTPRPITDLEDAVLLHRQVALQNQFENVQRQLIDAYESGDEAAKVEHEVRFNAISDSLLDLYNVSKKAGTETARGLSARRMLANEDYTLASMVTESRAAKGGRPLTETEIADIEAVKDEIDKTQRAIDEHVPDEDLEATRRLQAENDRAKQDFKRQVFRDRMEQRGPVAKAQDAFVKWRRGFLLSSPITLGKLTAAAVQRMVFSPIEEGIGGIISMAMPAVAKKARVEGGFRIKAEARSITDALTKGMADAYDTLRTGQSTLDVLYGKTRLMEPTSIDFFGHLHGALKAPVKRAAFSRAFEKLNAADLEHGIDITDPLVQTRNAILAYREANKAIFMQDNRIVDGWKRFLKAQEQMDAKTGEVPLSGKTVATVGRTLLPIVKVPTNIIGEALQYSTGLVTGSTRLALAMRKGVETLSEDNANLILRELKKGSIGGAFLLLGFLNPELFGGYYQRGEKRSVEDVKYGSARLFGEEIPPALLHNPLLETLQLGATVRRVADSKLHKKDESEQGIAAGAMAGALGIVDEVPFIREMTEVAKAFDPQSRGAFFGELSKSMLVPQALQYVATHGVPFTGGALGDLDASGDVTKRKPEGILEHIETGIPGFRKDVSEKKEPSIFKGER